MSSSDRQRVQEKQFQAEIEQLRGDLGETVEALAHKADVPARVKERGAELTERAVERARGALRQTPPDRWATLASAGLALVVVLVLVRRVRIS